MAATDAFANLFGFLSDASFKARDRMTEMEKESQERAEKARAEAQERMQKVADNIMSSAKSVEQVQAMAALAESMGTPLPPDAVEQLSEAVQSQVDAAAKELEDEWLKYAVGQVGKLSEDLGSPMAARQAILGMLQTEAPGIAARFEAIWPQGTAMKQEEAADALAEYEERKRADEETKRRLDIASKRQDLAGGGGSGGSKRDADELADQQLLAGVITSPEVLKSPEAFVRIQGAARTSRTLSTLKAMRETLVGPETEPQSPVRINSAQIPMPGGAEGSISGPFDAVMGQVTGVQELLQRAADDKGEELTDEERDALLTDFYATQGQPAAPPPPPAPVVPQPRSFAPRPLELGTRAAPGAGMVDPFQVNEELFGFGGF